MKKVKHIVILAGGDGDRLWPLKEKMLIPFLGKPFIQHIIDNVTLYGEQIHVVVNKENKERIKDLLKSDVQLIEQKEPYNGMAGAILSCKDKIDGSVLILGNDFFDFTRIADMFETEDDMVLFAKKTSTYFPGGYLKLEGKQVKGIIEKPNPDKVPSDLVRLVVDYIKDASGFIKIIEDLRDTSDSAYEQALTYVIQNKKTTYVEYNGYWAALKYPWHILSTTQTMLSQIKTKVIDPTVEISPTALIHGSVVIEKNVKIGDYVKIAGPCYIGEGAVIADYSLVRNSYIGSHCLIGSSCEIARSYIGNKVMLHRNYVGDSVLDEGVLFGAGVVTANFRFDKGIVSTLVKEKKVSTDLNKCGAIVGKNSKVGVNSTLFPGVKIGKNSQIGPGEIVSKDIKDYAFFIKGTESKK